MPPSTTIKLPDLPLEAWEESKETFHLYLQIIGKIRLSLYPKMNHWWHVPLYVTSSGLSTFTIPYENFTFTIDINCLFHQVIIYTSKGTQEIIHIDNLSIADFYQKVFAGLENLGIHTRILAKPYDLQSKIPFTQDSKYRPYDKKFITRFWQILVQADAVLKEFRGRFTGKSTPVHLFWHSFDLALTRFSGKPAPPMPATAGKVEREAYSHEVISFGFWAGDNNIREAAFYSYTYPAPEGLKDTLLKPEGAKWIDSNGSPMALLTYDAMRNSEDPKATLLEFLESTYRAGAQKAGWDIKAYELP